MKDQHLENRLKKLLHQPSAVSDKTHYETTLFLAKEELRQKQRRERISYARFLSAQIKFIGWKIWSTQGLLLAVTAGILYHFYEFLQTPQSLTRLLFCLSVFIFAAALPFIYRSVHYQMQEIEAATRFSSAKLLMAKLIIIGIGDISMMGIILLITVSKTSLQADSILLYLCIPFLLAGCGCLFMLGHFTAKHFFAGSMALCSFLVLMFASIPGKYELLFCQSFSPGWFIVCLVLAAICVQQFRYIIDQAPYAEMQID